MKFQHVLRDPIHGVIGLTACEWDLLRTGPFSRLRGIRQMGMAYVVFPGAHHTRFEHLVGAMATAWILLQDLPYSEDDRRLIRLAVLCHDLGHRPYSHSLEDAARRHADRKGLGFLRRYLDHEERTYELLATDPEIGAVLARHPDYRKIDRLELAQAATGRHPRREFNLFAHSEIDADRIDYVLRDNYYCGFPPGIDIQALSDLYVPDPVHGLVLNVERLYVAQELLTARFNLIANIQNAPLSRLGDLLLAECIREALEHAPRARQTAFGRVLDGGQDRDLEQFLQEHAPDSWARLRALVAGRPPVGEIARFDFQVLSPATRFGIQSLRIEGESVAQRLQDDLARDVAPPPLIDVARVKAPTEPVATTADRYTGWHGRLTDQPVVRGLIEASHDAASIRLYAPAKPRLGKRRFDRWLARYQASVDPLLSPERAERLLAGPWHGDMDAMGLLLALETFTFEALVAQVRRMPSRLDVLFLTVYLVLGVLDRILGERRVYLDGPEAIWQVVRHPDVVAGFGDRYPAAFDRPDAPGDFFADLAYLERCGLLYILRRLERVRNVFAERPKFGSTGWGRRLADRLAEPAGARRLAAVAAAVEKLIAPHAATYQEYFSLLVSEDESATARRRELRRMMPVPITR
ncbi:MAG: HD domain-containing protein [Candidatus Sericytochromatia bacterium]|nr:HD domain-containing protein [Candidatus Tanganyikabacteria bacterium]